MNLYGILVLKDVFLETEIIFFSFYKDIRDFWFVKPDPNMITLSFYKEISNVLSNMQTFAVVVDTVMLCPM